MKKVVFFSGVLFVSANVLGMQNRSAFDSIYVGCGLTLSDSRNISVKSSNFSKTISRKNDFETKKKA